MKTATISEIKRELRELPKEEIAALCIRLGNFKKENKELLTYLLYESQDLDSYILAVNQEMEDDFELINTSSFYFIAKSVRKILRGAKKHIRYTQSKKAEVEILLKYCQLMKSMSPSYTRSTVLTNLYERHLVSIQKALTTLDEDLQYDYQVELDKL